MASNTWRSPRVPRYSRLGCLETCYEQSAVCAGAMGARRDAKLSSKGAVEVRYITEAGIQGNIQDFFFVRRQARCRFAKAHAPDVLVGCDARDLLERAEEMVRAQACFSSKVSQR